jgi:hypothetical protein
MRDDHRFTIIACGQCGTATGERDPQCDECHGDGYELAPVLTFNELIDLLADTELDRTA